MILQLSFKYHRSCKSKEFQCRQRQKRSSGQAASCTQSQRLLYPMQELAFRHVYKQGIVSVYERMDSWANYR